MLIFIAHGSRKPEWRAAVEELTGSIRTLIGTETVELAYMDHGPPLLSDVMAAAVAGGEKMIRVLPLFLVSSGHVTADIHPRIEHLRAEYPQVEIELLPAIGEHPLFRDFLVEIAGSASREPGAENAPGTESGPETVS